MILIRFADIYLTESLCISRSVYFGQQKKAGDGNRTHVSSLEGWCSTIELHPHFSMQFGDKATLAREKVDSNKFGFQLSVGDGVAAATDNKDASKQALLTDAIEGCYMSGVGDTSANSVAVAYDAIVTPVSEAVTNTAIASVLFIIAWDAV